MARIIAPYSAQGSDKIHYPQIVDGRLTDVEALARWMDYAFTAPGGFRFGLAGFIGLIPGIGDILDALVSLYIVWRAVQIGIPRVTITRMVVNVGIESLIGSVPILGAMFDTVFKANRRNYQLLSDHLSGTRRKTGNDWWFVGITVLLLILSVAIPVVLIVELFNHL